MMNSLVVVTLKSGTELSYNNVDDEDMELTDQLLKLRNAKGLCLTVPVSVIEHIQCWEEKS
jgi:hypothetical protein